MIRCRFLPLNVDSFFDFKLKSCGSVISDVKALIRKKSATLCDLYVRAVVLAMSAKPLGIYPRAYVSTWSVIGPLTF